MPVSNDLPSRGPSPAVRYVDAADFGAHPVAWVVVMNGGGQIVLTVEGIPYARVEPMGLLDEVVARRFSQGAT